MININLLPPELKLKRIEAKRNASLISICLVCIIFVAILGIIARSLESTFEANLNTTRENIEKSNEKIEQYQNLQDLALLINDRWQTALEINQDRVYWSQVIQDLINSVPVNIQFENLNIKVEKNPNFVLQGNTTTEREIIKFKEKLEESVFFKNVTFKSSSLAKDQEEEKEKITFTLEFDLENKKID